MAMNNISFLVSSEKDSLLAFKDNSLANGEGNLGEEFLSQLNEAHNSMGPLLKGNINPDAENSIAIPKHKQPEKNENLSVKLDEIATGEVTFVSVEMLDQINSAQAMSTSVNKPFDTTNSLESENAELEATQVENTEIENTEIENTELKSTPGIASANTSSEVSTEVSTEEASVVQNPIATSVDSKAAKLTDSKSDNLSSLPLNSLPLNEGKNHKSGVAEGIEQPLNPINKKPDDSIGPIVNDAKLVSMDLKEQLAQGKPVDKSSKNIVLPIPVPTPATPQTSESEKSAAIDTLMTKDTSLIKANNVIASLTPEQRSQLNAQIKTLDNTDSTNSSTTNRTANLKQMLAQFITDNEEAQGSVAKQSFSSEIDTLNITEKQSLLTQLNAYIKAEQPKGEQLSVLKQTVNELKASIEIGLADTAKSDSKMFVAPVTQSAVNDSQKVSSKISTSENVEPSKAATASIKDENATKSSELMQKDGLKKITAEQTPARVAQVFTQITAALNTQQMSTLSQYDSLSYEQSLLDTQIQTQQLQSTSQVKQVSIDPGVMQAINIVKSDAAKLLQERVSSMLSINNKEAEIRLDPPEMGSMQIRIRSDAEQAHINFVVQNQQAKEALEQSMPRLREMLAQQGLELGESTISYGQSDGETAEHSEAGTQGNLANNKSVNDENDEQANNTAQSSRQQTSSSIDYYA
ncbi:MULTISPECIES: flagellar hook-length control protein FliK [unclassified Pseudoalteromonas]|jgi:flagellar hook-length control protein FliK|uniref:flagellar hook-length control protein FliK n=1 Tax=unclassified Pseudoalteromonas TaxID=194690 RepID=UPI0013FDBADF|nr:MULTISPECIES: flagellar hook-length control protein FliK [unclassified Pseudoalteromonas]MBA6409886.1 flagellar hook-length control protein FliK [Pseudoalteromonas sp. 5Ae-yellow]